MKPEVRQTPNLILAEGEDEFQLITSFLAHGSFPKCDVRDVKGKDNFSDTAIAAFKTRGPPIRSIGIVRDAETCASAQEKSTIGIFEALARKGLIPNDCIPSKTYLVNHSGNITTGFAIVPHDKEEGATENLCMRAPAFPEALKCTDQMFSCLDENSAAQFETDITREKARVQAYLAAAATKRVYHRCGLGAMNGLFDLDHACFDTIKEFIASLLNGTASASGC